MHAKYLQRGGVSNSAYDEPALLAEDYLNIEEDI